MKSIKEFCKEHKTKIVFVGCMIGSAVIGALVYKKANPVEEVGDPYNGKGKSDWEPASDLMTLEEVKELLDLNKDNNEQFIIFKEGANSDDYSCLPISDNVSISKSEKA